MDKRKAYAIFRALEKEYRGSGTALAHKGAFQLLVATILSAQCTDERVNRVTKVFFGKYKNAEDLARAERPAVEKEIRSTGFYRNKAKNIIGTARKILKDFNGRVPGTMEELISLPGVARKTANIVLFHAFGLNEGVAVDTHVSRLSMRLGFSADRDPARTERSLMLLFDRKDWGRLTDILISHGRKVCRARGPLCDRCPVARLCPSAGRG